MGRLEKGAANTPPIRLMRGTRGCPTIWETVLQALHDSDIGGGITWVNGQWQVDLGDVFTGFKDHEFVESAADAAEWFRKTAIRYFPDSPFAHLYRRGFE